MPEPEIRYTTTTDGVRIAYPAQDCSPARRTEMRVGGWQFGKEPNRQQITSDADQTPIHMTITHTVAAPPPDIIDHSA